MDPVSIAICVGIGVYVADKASNINLSKFKGIAQAAQQQQPQQPTQAAKNPNNKKPSTKGPASRG